MIQSLVRNNVIIGIGFCQFQPQEDDDQVITVKGDSIPLDVSTHYLINEKRELVERETPLSEEEVMESRLPQAERDKADRKKMKTILLDRMVAQELGESTESYDEELSKIKTKLSTE